MKLIVTIAALLFTGLAQASPMLGDYTEFSYTHSSDDQVLFGSYARSVIALSEKTVTILEDVTFPDREATRMENELMRTDILSSEQIQIWLDYCEENGGMKEIVSVPAGFFNTCRTTLMNELGEINGALWIGQVPLGIVKQDRTRSDGTSYSMALRTFAYGQ